MHPQAYGVFQDTAAARRWHVVLVLGNHAGWPLQMCRTPSRTTYWYKQIVTRLFLILPCTVNFTMQVLRLLRSQSAALHRLTALASGHSLLVLAAEGQPEQQQQQQQEQVQQQQQQEWRLLLRDLQRAEKEAGRALPSNAASSQPPQQPQQRQQQLDESILEGGADAATAVVDAMDTHVSQLPLFCFLLSYMLYDCLTPVQRAKCMVACYPW